MPFKVHKSNSRETCEWEVCATCETVPVAYARMFRAIEIILCALNGREVHSTTVHEILGAILFARFCPQATDSEDHKRCSLGRRKAGPFSFANVESSERWSIATMVSFELNASPETGNPPSKGQ